MKTKPKYYSHSYIQNLWGKKTKDDKISILNEALGHMQTYNGRSKTLCIAMAMGFENYEGDIHTFTKIGER